MAEHAPTTRRTNPHPGAAAGRRSLLAALAPAAAVLATAGAAAAAPAGALPDSADPSAPATVEGAARLEIVPYGPEIAGGVGTFAEWQAETRPHHAALTMMVAVLQKDHHQLAALARVDPDGVLELQEFLWDLGAYYKAQGEVLTQAATRLLIGAARCAVEVGAA